MKNLLFTSAAAALLLAGCSQNEPAVDPTPAEELVPIELMANVDTPAEIETKAGAGPITAAVGVNIAGWEGTTQSLAAAPKWTNTNQSVVLNAAASAITLNPLRYYSADGSINTYVRAWYPAGSANNNPAATGIVTFADTDGLNDVCVSNVLNGNKTTVISGNLTLNHLTSQLSFKAVKGTGMVDGTKITKIEIVGGTVPATLNLSTGAATASASKTLVAYDKTSATASAFSVPATAAEVTGASKMMIMPVANNTTIKLNVTTLSENRSVTYSNVAVTTDGTKFEAGKAYAITITVQQKGIELKANITPWTATTGAATVI